MELYFDGEKTYDLDNYDDVDSLVAEMDRLHASGHHAPVSPEYSNKVRLAAHADYEKRYGPLDPAEEARVAALVQKKLARIRRSKTKKRPETFSAIPPRPAVPLAARAM
jgi:hypothetical protein